MIIAEGAEGNAAEQGGPLAAVCTVVEPDSPPTGSRHAADPKPDLQRQHFYAGCHEQVKLLSSIVEGRSLAEEWVCGSQVLLSWNVVVAVHSVHSVRREGAACCAGTRGLCWSGLACPGNMHLYRNDHNSQGDAFQARQPGMRQLSASDWTDRVMPLHEVIPRRRTSPDGK